MMCLVNDLSEKNLKKNIEEFRNQIRKEIFCEEDVFTYLKNHYSVSDDIVKEIKDFISGEIENTEKVTSFLDYFEQADNFHDKMKLICEFNLTEEERNIILDQISIVFKNYYKTLGPDKCKSLSYNSTLIKREYEDLQFDKNKLKESVLSLFKVNERYSKSSIKDSLAKLYSDLGYNKTAKATDLDSYFTIKDVIIIDKDTKKREKSFELLSLKND